MLRYVEVPGPGDGRWSVAGGCRYSTTVTVAGLAIGDDCYEAVNVERVDAVGRQVLSAADSSISHDGDAAARLIGMRSGSITTRAVARGAVKRMICSPLMSHLVRDIVDRKRVSDGVRLACYTARLTRPADNARRTQPRGRDRRR